MAARALDNALLDERVLERLDDCCEQRYHALLRAGLPLSALQKDVANGTYSGARDYRP